MLIKLWKTARIYLQFNNKFSNCFIVVTKTILRSKAFKQKISKNELQVIPFAFANDINFVRNVGPPTP